MHATETRTLELRNGKWAATSLLAMTVPELENRMGYAGKRREVKNEMKVRNELS